MCENIKNWIATNLPKNGIIVEAGTADGNDTVFFANHFCEGKVYGFEPYPNYFNETKNKTQHFNNVKLCNKALAAKTDKMTLYVSDLNGGDWGSSSILKPKEHLKFHPAITFKSSIEVETQNLDEWFLENKLVHIDLMWLDIQGAEPDVLMNSPLALSKTRYLYTEVSLAETYENVILWKDFRKFLESNNFEVISEELCWQDMGNILLRNNSFR
jgi:2-O-methyltransferase